MYIQFRSTTDDNLRYQDFFFDSEEETIKFYNSLKDTQSLSEKWLNINEKRVTLLVNVNKF